MSHTNTPHDASARPTDRHPDVAFVDLCTETVDGDPDTRIRLSFQIRVF